MLKVPLEEKMFPVFTVHPLDVDNLPLHWKQLPRTATPFWAGFKQTLKNLSSIQEPEPPQPLTRQQRLQQLPPPYPGPTSLAPFVVVKHERQTDDNDALVLNSSADTGESLRGVAANASVAITNPRNTSQVESALQICGTISESINSTDVLKCPSIPI